MDKLLLEVLHAILIRTETDGDLIQLALICRKFVTILDGDITFALAHFQRRFQLPKDWAERYFDLASDMVKGALDAHDQIVWDHLDAQLNNLGVQAEQRDNPPFAYQAALFVMASQIMQFGMASYPADRTLRIVRLLDSDHPIHWENAFKYFARWNHVSTIDYVITNQLFGTSNAPLLAGLNMACFVGHAEIVSRIITCQGAIVPR
ncbi:hypothetical protein HDU78_003659 [Chytriomyces hyalinus]|nr:hypothetical protein HDU78_003659 [Chytriomyces hyalinus]